MAKPKTKATESGKKKQAKHTPSSSPSASRAARKAAKPTVKTPSTGGKPLKSAPSSTVSSSTVPSSTVPSSTVHSSTVHSSTVHSKRADLKPGLPARPSSAEKPAKGKASKGPSKASPAAAAGKALAEKPALQAKHVPAKSSSASAEVASKAVASKAAVVSKTSGRTQVPLLKPVPPKPKDRPPQRKLPQEELTRIRHALGQKYQALTKHIQSELSELEKPEKKHRTDLEEIASDTHDTDSLCEIMGMESAQIEQIKRALAKIDGGTYGICEDCGAEIPLARLEALPFATQCIECKRKAELRGIISDAASAASSGLNALS